MDNKLTQTEAERYWQRVHLTASDDLKAVCFPDKSRSLNAFVDRIQRTAISRSLTSLHYSVAGKRVLDLGTGRGRWLRFFREQQGLVEGADISPEAVQYCREKGYDVRQESVGQLSFRDGEFDLVAVVTVLLHVPPDVQRAAVSEMIRVCRPGGLILLLQSTTDDSSAHVWGQSVGTWLRLFASCEVKWVENHYFVPLLRLLWKSPADRLPRRMYRAIEGATVAISRVIEAIFMRAYRGRRGSLGMQHLMIFQKPPGNAGE